MLPPCRHYAAPRICHAADLRSALCRYARPCCHATEASATPRAFYAEMPAHAAIFRRHFLMPFSLDERDFADIDAACCLLPPLRRQLPPLRRLSLIFAELFFAAMILFHISLFFFFRCFFICFLFLDCRFR